MIGSTRVAIVRRRRGITLTEVLIAIMILGVGMVSLATLFPLGLLKLREATRYTRSALLVQSAACDIETRQLFSSQLFANADNYNYYFGLTPWYTTQNGEVYNPLTQDTPYYFGDWITNNNGTFTYLGANATGSNLSPRSGPGLPFAYDPLWRYQTTSTANSTPGYYMGDQYEARFGSGIGFIRPDNANTGSTLPSAHGLQRITNFNRPTAVINGQTVPIMPASLFVPNIFVSQEDLVWQDPKVNTYTLNGLSLSQYGGQVSVATPSAVVPDLSAPAGSVNQNAGGSPSLDWRYTWMFTGQLTNVGNASSFDGNIVIWENRPFGIQVPVNVPFAPGAPYQNYQVDGETVVEAIFGYSNTVIPPGGPGAGGAGYGSAADRTVLLRWSDQIPDPVVRVGDWIADVTYERQFQVALSRFYGFPQLNNPNALGGLQNWANNFEWDNTPAQRCYWYQVQKVTPAGPDPNGITPPHRSMVVYVNQSLVSRTPLQANGQPYYINAALIAPNVINVIPQSIFLRSSSTTIVP